ncbi:MAG: TCP-1/cpn60 chaperonin family protein [Dehalococcoidia bacterium]
MLEGSVREVKEIIAEHDGVNVADARFVRQVDELLSVFYDDIGEISNVSSRTLFDLFVIKVLYVGRRSTDAAVVDYLGELLNRYLFARELFPVQQGGRQYPLYLSELLEETLRRIALNAGKDGSVLVQEVKKLKKGAGYDAQLDDFGDMQKKGIIDPLKVTRAALENAVSIAGMVLTTNCLVTDIPEKKEGAAPTPPMY